MTYRMIFTAGLLTALAAAASADMRTIAEVHEVRMSNFRAPASENGVVAFRACDDCAQQVVAVTPATRYLVNDKVVTLAEFRRAVLSIPDRNAKYLMVKHHLESETVTNVAITL